MNKARCWMGLVLMLAWPAAVLAQSQAEPTEAQKAEASNHFTRGVELFQEQAFRAALVEFERAYEIAPDYRLLYNIGQAKLRLQDYLGAVQSYESYLSSGGSSIAPERRGQVESALGGLRDRVGRLAVSCNRSGAEVFIDDVSVGSTPLPGTLPVNVGRHRVLVRTADGASESQLINVAGGDIAEVSLKLAEAQAAASSIASPAPESMSRKRVAAIASWAGGAALLVGGAVTGGLALSAQSDLDVLLKAEVDDPQALANKRASIDTLALTTDVLIGTGAAALVVGTVLWLIDAKAQRKDKTDEPARGATLQVQIGPNAALLRGTF